MTTKGAPRNAEAAWWIANDEWLHNHHQEMTEREIAKYIALRMVGLMSEPTLDKSWSDISRGLP